MAYLLKIEGIGTLEYSIEENRGSHINFIVQAFYVTQFYSDLRLIYALVIKIVKGNKAAFNNHRNVGQSDTYKKL